MKCLLIPALFLFSAAAPSQDLPPIWAATDYARPHLGLATPEVLHSVNPAYTPQALASGIEGSVVLQVVISKHGRVSYASVLSPLPGGLDQKALAAIKDWRFTPGVVDGEIVPVLMTVDVLFKLPYRSDRDAVAQQHKAFQSILVASEAHKVSPGQIADLSAMAHNGLCAALELLGEWKLLGQAVPKDVDGGLADIRRAAEANNAKALSFLGQLELEGKLVPRNEADGWRLIQRAAFFGSLSAQQALGERDERRGNFNDAKWFFRMCAARSVAVCEYGLGKLLVSGPGVNPNSFSQGVAWLELAKDHGYKEADLLYRESAAKLSSIQLDWVAALEPHLELHDFHEFQ